MTYSASKHRKSRLYFNQIEAQQVPDDHADDAPALTSATRVSPGDTFVLGDHYLHCGDASWPSTYKAFLGDDMLAQVNCLWTDPPYAVGYNGKRTKHHVKRDAIANDGIQERGGLMQWLQRCFSSLDPYLTPSAHLYLAHPDGPVSVAFRTAFETYWEWKQTLIWSKGHVMGRMDYHYCHEPILYGQKRPVTSRVMTKGSLRDWYGPNSVGTVFEIPKPLAAKIHPTMKPVALVSAMLSHVTREGDFVLDPFGGSGTTLIACEILGRACLMIELDPSYCEVILQRWERLTSRQAVRC